MYKSKKYSIKKGNAVVAAFPFFYLFFEYYSAISNKEIFIQF